jgi:serine/threonine-protein kinase
LFQTEDKILFRMMEPRLAKPTSSDDDALVEVGSVIDGKYRIEALLGEGGMGVVLAAHHEILDQRVAIKILTAQDKNALSRFLLEARATAQLRSEHVARIMDVGSLPTGEPFIVLEYLEGCDLAELIYLDGRLPMPEAIDYVLQAMEGLAQAHALGIVHRDLKPANLFLATQPNGATTVKVLDFGISKSIASRKSSSGVITGEHATMGSPTYMAPEQIRSAKHVDMRSDIWSLGVVLFELLSGRTPFPRESVGEIFASILERDAPSLTTVLRGGVPAALSDAVARCLRRDREERFPNVAAFARAIAPYGLPSAAERVARIEQTLHHVKVRSGEGDVLRLAVPTPSTPIPLAQDGFVVMRDGMLVEAHDLPTTEIGEHAAHATRAADAETLDVHAVSPEDAAQTGSAFTTDPPRERNALVTTGLSRVNRARRRARIASVGLVVLAASSAVVLRLALGSDAKSDVTPAAAPPEVRAPVVAAVAAPPPPVAAPAPTPVETFVAPRAPAPSPATHANAVAKPSPKPAIKAPAHPAPRPPSPPSSKKRPSVLDSPD